MSVGYQEEIKGFSRPISNVVMVSLGFAAGTSVKKTSAACRDLSLEFIVFVKIQERANPSKLSIYLSLLFGHPNELLFLSKFFYEELVGRRIPGTSGTAISTVYTGKSLIDLHVPRVSIFLFWKESFSRKRFLNRIKQLLSGFSCPKLTWGKKCGRSVAPYTISYRVGLWFHSPLA